MPFARPALSPNASRLALLAGASLAAGLVSGCSGAHAIRSASAAMPERTGAAEVKADKAVVRAEAAVAKAPDQAVTRAALGKAYLAAGRFGSAATALSDAMTLGDNSGSTALSLALAQIGCGQQRQAVALLDQWRDEIPASDLGLALALAGETSRGVAILADAVRSGESTAKLRQNLAYAYALDGRWTDAKLMAAQDVPGDQLDKRMAYWALSMLPSRNVDRVAALIGAPIRLTDPGQPAALALTTSSEVRPQMAVQQVAPVPAIESSGELAPVSAPAQTGTVAANITAQQAAATAARPAVTVHRTVAEAFAGSEPVSAVMARPAPVRTAAAAPRRARPLHVATVVKPVAQGTHFVQLGAFSTEQGARRAWGIYTGRNPGLAAFRMTITPATVKGRQVYRVAAGGLGGNMAANTLCGRVKASGGECFAYGTASRFAPLKAAPAALNPRMAAAMPTGPQRARR